jgi:nucleoside-diphosphate-sugar epimerase
MSKTVLVVGGTRFFGRLLVSRLIHAGHRVTLATRGRTADTFGSDVDRIAVDRRDAAAMTAAFADRHFDLVFDQMAYSPRDAAIAAQVFAGRVGRYVMTSTIEVYDHLRDTVRRPLSESDLALEDVPIDFDYPWEDQHKADIAYGAGKRQAEALLTGRFGPPTVTVRVGHVLAGPEDFTGRLAHYVKAAVSGAVLRYSAAEGVSSFIDGPGIARFLAWVGDQDFTGPVNAAADGTLSAAAIFRRVGEVAGCRVRLEALSGDRPPNTLSPFDYARDFVMDTSRAAELGHRFRPSDLWLDGLIEAHLAAGATA